LNKPLRGFKETKEELEMNGTHQLLIDVVDVKLLSKNINMINKTPQALLYSTKEENSEN
jgi:hypothetical protein